MKPTRGMMTVVAGLGLLTAGGLAAAGEPAPAKSDPLAEAKLELKIEGQLTRDERLSQQPVIVEANDGVLTLSGTVTSEAERARAEQIARSAGADRIDNRLTVAAGPTPSTQPAQDERGALSDPHRRDPLVGSRPAEQTGSKEVRLRTTGLPDPVLEKREAEQKQKTPEARPAPASETRRPTPDKSVKP
jgi:hypothetical protein